MHTNPELVAQLVLPESRIRQVVLITMKAGEGT
jgi:hypothetical protein